MRPIDLALSLAFAALSAGAQQNAPEAPAAQPPTFRAATDIIEVDVVAQRSDGGFVADLRPEEFELRDDGHQRSIDFLYVVGSNAPRLVAKRGAEAEAVRAMPATIRAGPSRIFVVIFDNRHLTATGFKRVQAAARTLFSNEFGAGDFGAVVTEGRLVSDRFTTDREELLRGVQGARPEPRAVSRRFASQEWPRMSAIEAVRIVQNNDRSVMAAVIQRACADEPALCQNAESAVRSNAAQLAADVRGETGLTLQTMLTLLRGLQRFEGRKTVLLLTEGFLAHESWPLVQDAVSEAARANARIYTLDARGLDRSGMADYLAGFFPRDEGVSALLKQLDYSDDALNSLAVDTGGFVVRNANYFDNAVHQIINDAGTYYVIGYRPQSPPDGKFHRVDVRVTRPGVLVRARRGYLATLRPAVTTAAAAAPEPGAAATVAPGGSDRREPSVTAAPSAATIDAARGPAPAVNEATAAPTASRGAPASGYRLRPDADKHVDLLLRDEQSDRAATAGWDAYQRGDLATARASLENAAASPAARPWVHYALGMAEYGLGDFSGSLREWEAVRHDVPDFEPVYFDLVDGCLHVKDYDHAVRVLRAARERWPRDVEVYNALGVVQTVRGVLDDAVKSFQEAIVTAPEEPTSYFNLGRAMEIRYHRTRRYVQQLRAWVSNEQDRAGAIENYRRYLEFGGPFASDAQEGIGRLSWASR
jgi:VWFA-related protein